MQRIITLPISMEEMVKISCHTQEQHFEYLRTEYGLDPLRIDSITTVYELKNGEMDPVSQPVIMVHINSNSNYTLTLEEQLAIAISKEDYEKATELRDKLSKNEN